MKNSSKTNYLIFFKYISTIISWTIFVLLSIIGALLIYYFASSRLYVTKGDKYEPFFSVYTIVSGSMEPTIKVYDVIINTKVNDPKDVKVNDVITFTSTSDISNGKTVTHRVIGVREMDDGGICYVTRGDNNTTEDPSCATYSNVIGKVSAVVPGLGKIQFFLASKFGWLLIIVVPALYIIIKDLLKLFKMSRNKDGEETTDNIDNTMVIGNLIKRNNLIDEEENEKNEFITHRDEKEDKNYEKQLPMVSPKTDLVIVDDNTECESDEVPDIKESREEDNKVSNEESYDQDVTELEEKNNISYEDEIIQGEKNSDDDKSMDEDISSTDIDSHNEEEAATIEYDYSNDIEQEDVTNREEDKSNINIEVEEKDKNKNNFYNNDNNENKHRKKKKKNNNNLNYQNNNNQFYRKSNNSSFYNFFDDKSD